MFPAVCERTSGLILTLSVEHAGTGAVDMVWESVYRCILTLSVEHAGTGAVDMVWESVYRCILTLSVEHTGTGAVDMVWESVYRCILTLSVEHARTGAFFLVHDCKTPNLRSARRSFVYAKRWGCQPRHTDWLLDLVSSCWTFVSFEPSRAAIPK